MLGTASTLSLAQIVAAPGSGAHVIQTQNGLKQVNIARPSAAGVSVGTFSQFDVPGKGAILNNSPTLVQSQLGGYINGNLNLTPGNSARIIVNQVLSNAPSRLNGAVEVAGARAQVIVANPSGIVVNGANFINTSRAVLTTGTPNYGANGSLTGFTVNGGNITVEGAGLNAANVDQVDLLSRAIQINSAVYANNLNAIAGPNVVDYASLATTPMAGTGPAPAVAIDVSQLGGMYANRIVLIGNEYGVGVSNRGVLAAQAGDLTLKSNGQLVLAGTTQASGSISANAAQGIDNSGTTYAQRDVVVATSGTLTNSGTLAAQQNTSVNAGGVSSTGTIGAGINQDGSIAQGGDLTVTASGALDANGRNAAGGNATFASASMNLAGSSTTANGNLALIANAGDMNVSRATSTAGGVINVNAAGTLATDNGALKSGGAQSITAGALSNRNGQIISGGWLTANIVNAILNQGGTIQSAGSLAARAGSVDNSAGHFTSLNADGLSLAVSSLLNNGQGGTVGGNGSVTAQAGQLINAGSITAVQNLVAGAAQWLANSGALAANGNTIVSAGTTLTDAGGAISAGQTATVKAATLDNSNGTITGDQLSVTATNLVNHNGTLTQTGTGATTLAVSGTVDNAGGTIATNATSLTLTPGALINESGKILHAGTGTLAIDTGALSNDRGTIITNGALVAKVRGALSNQSGEIQAAGAIDARADSVANANGHIASLDASGLSLSATTRLDNGAFGSVGGNGNVNVQAGQLVNAGSITAVQNLVATATQSLANAGTLAANGNTTVTAGTTLTDAGGSISAGQTATVSAATLDNSNGTITGDQLNVSATNLVNHNGALTQTGTRATTLAVTGTLDNANGAIATNARDLSLTPAELINDDGKITDSGAGTLSISTSSLSNVNGTISTNGALNANVSGALSNRGGTMQASGALSASAGSLDNGAGSIASLNADGLNFIVSGLLNNAQGGTIGGNGNVVAQAGQIVNAGSITAVQDLVAAATQSLLNSGTLAADGQATVTAGTTLTDFGAISAGRTATVKATTLDNSHGAIIGAQLNVAATDLVNHNGTLTQTGTDTTTLAVTGTLDNASGTIATNARDLSMAPAALINDGGRITDSGTGTLSINTGSLSNVNGTIATNGALNANVSGALSNWSGTLQSGGALSASAASLENGNGRITALNSNSVTLTTTGLLNNAENGLIASNGDVSVQAGTLVNAGSITAMQNLIARAVQTLSNGGTLAANGMTTVSAGTMLTNAGTIAGSQLALSAYDLINRNGTITQMGAGATRFTISGTLNNTLGSIQTNAADLTITPAALLNDNGVITSSGTGTLSVQTTNAISNNGGTIATNGALDIKGGALSNQSGTLAAQTSVSLDVASLDNRNGGYVGAQNVSITDAGALDNRGGIMQANASLNIQAQDIANDQGAIANGGTSATTVNARGALSNTGDGLIGGNGDVSVSGDSVDNSGGTLVAGGTLSAQSSGRITNRAGLMQAGQDLSVSALGDIDNVGGQIEADGATSTLSMSGASIDNSNGRVANSGTGATTITADVIVNNNANGVAGAGTIGGNGDVSVNARAVSNTNGAQILAGHDLALTIAQLADNTNATLSGANALTLNGPNAALLNAGGSVHANGAMSLDTASIDNSTGRIGNDQGSGGSVTIRTGALANQNGAIGSDQNLTLTTNTLTGDGRVIVGNDGAVTLDGDYTLDGVNQIQANHDLSFTTTGTFTNQGTLAAVNALTVNANNVDNQASGDLNSASTTVNAKNTITNQGRIEGDTVSTQSATLANTGTIIGSVVTVNGTQSVANVGAAAAMAAASELDVYSRGDISNTQGANLFSLGNINIAGDATRDANGLLATRANSVTNDQSTIEALGNIEVATDTLTNTRPAPTVETVTTDVEEEHQTKRAKYIACTTTGGDSHAGCGDDVLNYGYKAPLTQTFSDANVISTTDGMNAVDRVLVVSIAGTPTTIYYNTLTQNADGTITVKYWDGYDPHINYDPATEYASRDDAHNGWQRVEVARDTTTTTQKDQITGTQAPQAQLLAGGTMTLANVGTVNNAYSAIAAGDAIYIGSAVQNGELDASGNGNVGGTIVNNIGQTLYQYQRQDIVSTYAWNEDKNRDVGTITQPSIVPAPVAIGGTGGTIVANNLIDIYAREVNNTNVAAASSATGATGGTLGANTAVTQVSGGSGNSVSVAGGTSVNAASGDAAGTASGGARVNAASGDSAGTASGGATVNTANGSTTGTVTGNAQTVNAPQSVAGPTGALTIPLPTSGLYHYNTAPDAPYLIATDPRLTSYTSFISSDYMLNALNLDPMKTEKRLGDGLYEQQLIRNQITQLAGRVYLQGYTSAEDEYRALMSSGVNYAQAFNLTPGMALTAAQMDALTSDTVWLVDQLVTLPDGTTQHVLAPVVYLAQAHANDLQPTGALISADDVQIHTTGSVTNSGVIKGGTQTAITGTNILNRGGSIGSDGTTVISASNDLLNASGRISGNRVAVLAGHDVVNTTLIDAVGVSSAAGNSKVQQTLVGAQGTIVSTGDMVVAAGHDLTVHGASIGAGGNAQITAGHDMLVDTVQSTTSQSVTKNADHHWEENTTLNQTSGISAGGSLAMQSGNDMTFKGAQVSAGQDMVVVAGGNLLATTVTDSRKFDNVATDDRDKFIQHTYDEETKGTTFSAGGNATLAAVSADKSRGNVTLTGSSFGTDAGAANIVATGDVTLNEGREEHDDYAYRHSERGSVVHSTTTDQMQNTQTNIGVGSTVSGDSVNIQSGHDLTIKGASIVGQNDVNLTAANNVTVTTTQDTQSGSSYDHQSESGLMGNGALSMTVGTRSQTDEQQSRAVIHNGSVVGSLDGNLNIKAANALNVMDSTLHAGQDVSLSGKSVSIGSAYDTNNEAEQHRYRQSGVTVGVSNAVVAAGQTAQQMGQAARNVNGDARLIALAGATTALAAKNAYDAVGGDPIKAATTVGVNVSAGSSKSQSQSQSSASTAQGSTIAAGRDVNITATGAGTNSDITITGSTISAGRNAVLSADGDVTMQAAQSTSSQHGTNSGSSWGAGASFGVGSQTGVALTGSVSGNRGHMDGDSSVNTNTHVAAGETLAIHSGGDTTLRGAVVSGKAVLADVGGNLNIESLQDTEHYDSKQQSAGAGVSIPVSGVGKPSVSASVSQQQMNSDYASVTEQSGIKAGAGGFDINVKGNTDLKGGVIASDADASKNSLTTGTLTYSDIENRAKYDATSFAASGGYSFGGGNGDKSGIGKNQKGTADNVNPVPGTELPKNDSGLAIAPPVAMAASGDASTTTKSGISAGTIKVADEAHQTQDIASLNRDTSDTGGVLAPIFDKDKIENGFAIASQFTAEAGTFVANRVKQADAATQAAKDPNLTPEQRAQAQQQADELNKDWGPNGTYRQALTALTVAAGGNVTGGAGQYAQAATVAYLQELGANGVKQIADGLGSESARAALHAIVGCAGGAGSGASCGAGAMGAAASSVIGSLMSSTENMSAADRLVRENLVNSLVAGVATGMGASGADMATAAGAAQIEVQNNQVALGPQQTTPIFTPNDPNSPFRIPGLEWLTGNKGDGVTADPAAQLDPSSGVHVTPNPGQQLADAIFTPIADTVSGWIDSVKTMAAGDRNRMPIPETVTAGNGLQVQSNPKHTPGMSGNNKNAGTEPDNSLELFNNSVPGKSNSRYAIDESGNINRYSSDGNVVYHWSGSTGDSKTPLDVSSIPIGVRRDLGFKGK
uniref:hemagglutinin repeat-containing protein n=1 Tax=Caballeronia glebae TaxID=1777143 RepID=UPI0038BC57E6